MPWLSLIMASLLLFVSLFAFMGGLGPLLAIGEYSDSLGFPDILVWSLEAIYFAVFFGGIISCIVCFRGLRNAFGSALDRPMVVGDHVVVAGHIALLAALANALLWHMHLWDWDLFYLLLMLAAMLYSFGLGALAVIFRAKPARNAL